jgi:Zn-dependent peptidase ImmA (M78 family)
MAGNTLTVEPQLLRWARERVSLAPEELARKVNLKPQRVTEWEQTGKIEFGHLERLADKTYTPIGYLFLRTPPVETLPISDFRTVTGEAVRTPSPNLLDTIVQCQQRQSWYRDYLIAEGEEPVPFVGSVRMEDRVEDVARDIRETIGLYTKERAASPTWDAAFNAMVEQAEAARILVMRNGVVGSNTHRKLDVEEFRGFALSDDYAPLVFINNADANVAKPFTLAHELTHIWLGQSGVSDVDINSLQEVERYCNLVAAELLVPREELSAVWGASPDKLLEARQLARAFKVSTLVILIRARDAGLLPQPQFRELYEIERGRPREESKSSGGDFYRSHANRVSRRLARAVIQSALEGQTPYTEAFRLLSITKEDTFNKLAERLRDSG